MQSKAKIPELEGLRGLAAAYVAIHHALGRVPEMRDHPLAIPLRFGIEAVMVFFILSGFVIAYSTERSTGIDYRRYFILRFRRIYPVFLVSLLLGHLCASYGTGGVQPICWKTLLGNILMLQDINKPGIVIGPFAGNGPLWSLSYEMWFYTLYALALFVIRERRHQLAAVTLLSCASIVTGFFFPNPASNFCALMLIWWSGVEISRLVSTGAHLRFSNLLPVHAVLSLPLLWFLWRSLATLSSGKGNLYFADHPFVELRMYASCLICLLLLPVILRIGFVKSVLANRFLVWLGGISYALYLFHIPIIKMDTGATPVWISFPAKLVLLVFLAWLAESKFQMICNHLTKRLL